MKQGIFYQSNIFSNGKFVKAINENYCSPGKTPIARAMPQGAAGDAPLIDKARMALTGE